jgi:ABC-type uncharacterized transport system substrate-binding protein
VPLRAFIRLVRAVVLAAVASLLAAPGSAGAHPHVFIEYSVTVLMGAAGVEAVQFTWTFDEFTSAMIMQQFDANRDGALSPAEVRNLERGHFAETRESQYFVAMRLNDTPVPVDGARDFTARVAGGLVTYAFTVPVKRPQGSEGRLEVLAEDPTVFIAFDLSPRAPVQVRAPAGFSVDCRAIKDPKGAVLDFVRCTYKRGGR